METLGGVEALLTAIDEDILTATVTVKVTVHNDVTLLQKPEQVQQQSVSFHVEQVYPNFQPTRRNFFLNFDPYMLCATCVNYVDKL